MKRFEYALFDFIAGFLDLAAFFPLTLKATEIMEAEFVDRQAGANVIELRNEFKSFARKEP